jgi:hypothetical protein
LDVRRNYVELDREGAVNNAILGDPTVFHPSCGFSKDFGHNRNAVPRFIAGPAIDRQRFNALLLLTLALTNSTIAFMAVRRLRTTSVGKEDGIALQDRNLSALD